ncbi:uncharacterized protein LY89DRAFT_735138 [Mollisia scopiformis]|uniref:Uncharacterized protein n=1 Tax=Mollisia scopiformis TaxID=149040 RepID=A0A194X745_MOLSC|nr:uncharacterized protein LY89DRAFT_735138 [Mollisia scopiformis]KUJ15995.1 hypothetical protein LY89DRAFT_735138 [Mollisia scopiformis]
MPTKTHISASTALAVSAPAVVRPTIVPATATSTSATSINPSKTINNGQPVQTAGNDDPPGSADPPVGFTIDGTTLTPNSESGLVFATQTLRPGSQITYSGTVLSMAADGSSLIFGGTSTQVLAQSTAPAGYIVGSQVLVAGAPAITVSGTLVSLEQGGSSVVIGGTKTEALSDFLGSDPTVAAEYRIGDQILQAGGPAITILGTRVSLDADGSTVVVGTETEALSEFTGSSGCGIGGAILSVGGFGSGDPEAAISSSAQYSGQGGFNGTAFTGAAVRRNWGFGTSGVALVVIAFVGWWL